MIKIHIFHTGKVIVDPAIPYKNKNPFAFTGLFRDPNNKITLAVSSYLIEHPKGNILIDTGWDSKYAYERPSRFFGILDKISTASIQKNEGIDQKLQSVGIRPEELKCVFFSHLDFDHTSGIRLVKNAPCFKASAQELKDADSNFFRYAKDTWKDVHIQPFEFADSGIGPVGRSYDVFNDGSIQLINTPGHSHGHCSVRVEANGKYIILAGDAAYTQRSIREEIIPGLTVSSRSAKQSIAWLHQCANDPTCLLVAPNHDPEINEQTIVL